MTIHNMYIFDKFGTLLYYGEWNRVKQSGITREEVPPRIGCWKAVFCMEYVFDNRFR